MPAYILRMYIQLYTTEYKAKAMRRCREFYDMYEVCMAERGLHARGYSQQIIIIN